MKTKIQIKSIFGRVLFEYETENNTIGKTVDEANLRGANLYGADLRGANLRGANLYGANLYRANLYGANLYRADLREADLRRDDLRGANLRGANLYGANLYRADLYGANLYGADLYGADLYGADLYGADLREADLREAKGLNLKSLWFNQTRILPEGDIIGYKKCRNDVIVKLLIPSDAKRSHAFGRKCRAEYAKVIEFYNNPDDERVFSTHYSNFEYIIGETVSPTEPFSENWVEECESGIHFFITKVEAEKYQ